MRRNNKCRFVFAFARAFVRNLSEFSFSLLLVPGLEHSTLLCTAVFVWRFWPSCVVVPTGKGVASASSCSAIPLVSSLFLSVLVMGAAPAETCANIPTSPTVMAFGCDLSRVFDYDGSNKDVWINCACCCVCRAYTGGTDCNSRSSQLHTECYYCYTAVRTVRYRCAGFWYIVRAATLLCRTHRIPMISDVAHTAAVLEVVAA